MRTRGTVGGSLAHADPAADWLACLTALRAEVVITGPDGMRRDRLHLGTFIRGALETDLRPAELITAVRIPRFPREARFGFHKICRKTGELADAIGVVAAIPRVAHFAGVIGAIGQRPAYFEARRLSWPTVMALDDARSFVRLVDKETPIAGDDYDHDLYAVALKRAYDEAFAA